MTKHFKNSSMLAGASLLALRAPEVKDGTGAEEPAIAELKSVVTELATTVAEFKAADKRGASDEEIARISKAISEKQASKDELEAKQKAAADEKKAAEQLQEDFEKLQLQVKRMQMGNPGSEAPQLSADQTEHKTAFFDYLTKGNEVGLAALEQKALNVGSDVDGGFAVPEELDRVIEKRLRLSGGIRSVANVIQIGSANYKKLVQVSGAASGWVGEADGRAETDTPQFAAVTPPLGEIYANPAATQTMLDDSMFDTESWIAEELTIEFNEKEEAAFATGDGVDKPKGFTTYTTAATDDDTRTFGQLQHVLTGAAGAFAAADPSDTLIDLIHSMRSGYRSDALFVMNNLTLAAIRKFKDGDGNYIWRPGLELGKPSTLLGYSVIENDHMPAIGADSLSIAFGNFKRGYTITDRMGTRVLRDPFSNKPYVHFYATRRVGGGVVNSDAIKFLKFGA